MDHGHNKDRGTYKEWEHVHACDDSDVELRNFQMWRKTTSADKQSSGADKLSEKLDKREDDPVPMQLRTSKLWEIQVGVDTKGTTIPVLCWLRRATMFFTEADLVACWDR